MSVICSTTTVGTAGGGTVGCGGGEAWDDCDACSPPGAGLAVGEAVTVAAGVGTGVLVLRGNGVLVGDGGTVGVVVAEEARGPSSPQPTRISPSTAIAHALARMGVGRARGTSGSFRLIPHPPVASISGGSRARIGNPSTATYSVYASTGQHESAPPLGNTAPDVLDAVLHEGARFVEEVIQPLSAVGDVEGCIFRDGEVRTPPGFREADRQFVEAGWACVGAGAGSTIALDPEAF